MDRATDRHLGLEVDVVDFAVVIDTAMESDGPVLEVLQPLVFDSGFVFRITGWAAPSIQVRGGDLLEGAMSWAADAHHGLAAGVNGFIVIVEIAMNGLGSFQKPFRSSRDDLGNTAGFRAVRAAVTSAVISGTLPKRTMFWNPAVYPQGRRIIYVYGMAIIISIPMNSARLSNELFFCESSFMLH